MLVPYPGENSSISNFIAPRIPTNIESYIEPFGGMLGAFFSMIPCINTSNIFYCEEDYHTFNLMKHIRYDESFQNIIKSLDGSEEYYNTAIKRNGDSILKKATDYLIELCCGQSGIWENNIELEIFKMKFNAYKYRISKISDMRNQKWEDTIDEFDTKESFFYLDHPEKSSSWQLESHWKLSAKLRRLKGQFIICTNTFNGFEKAYRGMNIDKIRTLSGIKIIIS